MALSMMQQARRMRSGLLHAPTTRPTHAVLRSEFPALRALHYLASSGQLSQPEVPPSRGLQHLTSRHLRGLANTMQHCILSTPRVQGTARLRVHRASSRFVCDLRVAAAGRSATRLGFPAGVACNSLEGKKNLLLVCSWDGWEGGSATLYRQQRISGSDPHQRCFGVHGCVQVRGPAAGGAQPGGRQRSADGAWVRARVWQH